MVYTLSSKLTKMLVNRRVIAEADFPVYQFGMQSLIMKAAHIVSFLLIGLAFQRFVEVCIFTAAYVILRKYAGGYHAKTSMRCYLISCLIIIVLMLFIRLIPQSIVLTCTVALLFICGITIFCLVPVDSSNKPLDRLEFKHYRKRARIILIIEIVIAIMFLLFHISGIAFMISLSLAVLTAMLVVGIIKNRIL